MDAVGKVTNSIELIISECSKTWPPALASTLAQPETPLTLALQSVVLRAREGLVSTLPFIRAHKNEVLWLTLGGDAKALLEYSEDLKSWVVPAYGTKGTIEFIQSASSGRLMNLIKQTSPAGYLRWSSDLGHLSAIVQVLSRMHSFLIAMPEAPKTVPQSLHVLRFRFVTALRLGQWDIADSVVGEIDRLNLEQAHKTMQMRVRVLGESGDYSRLLELIDKHRLWALPHPVRVAEVILTAVIQEVLIPLERSRSFEKVFEELKPWHPKLLSLLSTVPATPELSRLFAYIACIDQDITTGQALLPLLDKELAHFVREKIPLPIKNSIAVPNMESASAVTDADDGARSKGIQFWQSVKDLIFRGSNLALRQQLDELDAQALDDPEFLLHAPDVLLELLSDPVADTNVAARLALQDVLTALIDTSFSVPDFPCRNHLELYVSLAEALVYLRGDSASDDDAQLLHGLLAAAAHLSPKVMGACTDLLRNWWHRRPTLGRAGWLIGVLDSLAPLHPNPHALLDLWC